jgi:2-methylcitrate dehydratase PrpD
MSLYYTLAAMAHDGEVLTEQFAESRLSDPRLLAFMRRIRIEADPQYDKGGDATRHQSRMTVTTTDGRRFAQDAPVRKGSPDFPMTAEERYAKFRRLAAAALSTAAAAGIIQEVEALEAAPSIAQLIGMMKP